MKKLILFSGGIDSSLLILMEIEKGNNPACISFNYGQTHSVELNTAKHTCTALCVDHFVYNVDEIRRKGNTYVGRNFILVVEALKVAINKGFDCIVIGTNADDSNGFADCTKDFLSSLKTCCATYGVMLEYPLADLTKKEVVDKFKILNGIYNITTWSCYDPVGNTQCGECAACQLKGDVK